MISGKENEPNGTSGNHKSNSSRGYYQRFHRWNNKQYDDSQNPYRLSCSKVKIISNLSGCTTYAGWNLYFPGEEFDDSAPHGRMIDIFETFLRSKPLPNKENIQEQRYFLLDLKEFLEDSSVKTKCAELHSEIVNNAELIFRCAGLAMHKIISQQELDESIAIEMEFGEAVHRNEVPVIYARPINHEPITCLRNIKASYYGKFLSVSGTVIRVGMVKPICKTLGFECAACSQKFGIAVPGGKYIQPSKCASSDCRGKSFTLLRDSVFTTVVDVQTIRLQESDLDDDSREVGRVPRTIDIECSCDLVDSCVPGDLVTICGVVKVWNNESNAFKNVKDKCSFTLYIEAYSVKNFRKTNQADQSTGGLSLDFSLKELYGIQHIQKEPNLFRLFVASLCPSIYGHEIIKAGLVLALFGASDYYSEPTTTVAVRGDPHILLVGDPGMGKSQLLQACTNVAPRGIYVCGNTTTSAGLTVSLGKNEIGDYSLDAGALVLGDQGCCCIDEFDKMGSQHLALLEAMEQQSISIAKAGIVCTLPARTSVLAAANPVGGHYDHSKTVSENIKLKTALLSRFDLIFILIDKPDKEIDMKLSEHIMALHGGRFSRSSLSSKADVSLRSAADLLDNINTQSIAERLKANEILEPVPHFLFRKYIAYARRYVHPCLSAEAASVLQEFYLSLRREHHEKGNTPITLRQLESLIRLTKARARLELREICTESDALDVIDIIKLSMLHVYMNENGGLDFKRSHHGSGMSKSATCKKFIEILRKIAVQRSNDHFSVSELKEISKTSGVTEDFETLLNRLNEHGFLIKRANKIFQVQSV